MSQSAYNKSPVISGFAGEDINSPSLLIGPTVSPDALNNDYYRRTIRKRAGFLRNDDRPLLHGGLTIRTDTAYYTALGNVTFNPAGSFALSFMLHLQSGATDTPAEILRVGTPATDGFSLNYTGTQYQLKFETSGGQKTITVTQNADVNVGIMIVYFVGASNKYYKLYVDSSTSSTSHATHTYTAPATPKLLFANHGGTNKSILETIDDLRWFDLSGDNDAAHATWLTKWTTDQWYKRELTAAEQADSRLHYYLKFDQEEIQSTGYFNPTKGSGAFQIPPSVYGLGSPWYDTSMARSLVSRADDTSRPFCTGLLFQDDLWFQLGAECWIRNDGALTLGHSANRWSEINSSATTGPITGRQWSWCRFRDRVVFAHPQAGLYYYDSDISGSSATLGLVKQLVPPAPDVTGVTATDSGSGTGPGASGADEVQTVTITGSPTGGTFKLGFEGVKTGTIAYNASAATVKTALEAVSTIGTDNVSVSGSSGGPYTVTFVGDLAGTDVALMIPYPSGLTGGSSPYVTVAETTKGIPASLAYSFKFFYYNINTGVHGPSSTSPVTVYMSTGNAIQFEDIDLMRTTRRDLEGVTHIRVFRTAIGGSTYYYVTDIALDDSPAADYTDADMNMVDADLAETNSEQALRYDLADLLPYRARSVVEHQGQLMLLAVDEAAQYNDPDVKSNVMYAGEPLATNLFSTDRRYEVFPNNNDYIMGGISVIGGLLIAKRYSLAVMFGDTPDQWNIRHMSYANGCVAGNTITASDSHIYMLSDFGIQAVPIPLGAGFPKNIASEKFRPLFDDMDPDSLDTACGVYWPSKAQYWVSFTTLTDGRITLVFNENTGAIAKLDLPIDAFYVHDPSGTAPVLMGCIHGYRVQLDYGTREGTDINAHVPAITGTVTSATTESATDTGQNWQHPNSYIGTAGADLFALFSGLPVTLVHANGTKERRRILWNNATTFWVTEPWSVTPVAGDTFYIGGIDWSWKSPKFSPLQDPTDEAQAHRLAFVMSPADDDNYAPGLDIWVDGVDVNDDNTFDATLRLNEFLINSRIREMEFKVSDDHPDQPVEIEGFSLGLEEARVRP